jgi:hypothetical protein
MAGHQMAAHFIAQLERALQIDPGARCPFAEGRQAKRFTRCINGVARAMRGLLQRGHRQAAAVMGDGCTQIYACGLIGGEDRKTAIIAHCLDLFDRPDGRDDACEHASAPNVWA